EVSELADRLGAASAPGGRVILARMNGLEVPARLMLRRALPGVAVELLAAGASLAPSDVPVELPVDGERFAMTPLCKAVQLLEGRRFRKLFPEYVVFDTETTGVNVDRCEVVELAAVRVRDGVVVDEFQTLVRGGHPIPAQATAVHGITDTDLVGAPA